MKRRCVLVSFLISFCFPLWGQQTSLNVGARAMALGYAGACLGEPWSLFNNVAGLSKVGHPATAFTYEAYPFFPAFNRMAVACVVPTTIGTAALGVFRFGDDLYSEQLASIAFANKMGIAALGARISYVQHRAETFGASTAWTVSAGGIADLTPHFSVGAHVVNINQPKITRDGRARTPTWLVLGVSFHPTEKMYLVAEIEKSLDTRATWKSGLEYQFHRKFKARTGINIHPRIVFGGLGFVTRKFHLDYAMAYGVLSGLSHQATVMYQFIR